MTFPDAGKRFNTFKYPEDDLNVLPSLFSLWAYCLLWAVDHFSRIGGEAGSSGRGREPTNTLLALGGEPRQWSGILSSAHQKKVKRSSCAHLMFARSSGILKHLYRSHTLRCSSPTVPQTSKLRSWILVVSAIHQVPYRFRSRGSTIAGGWSWCLRIPPGWQVDNYPFFTRGYLRVGMDGSNTSRRHRVPVFSSREHSQLVIMIAWIGRNDGNLGSGRIKTGVPVQKAIKGVSLHSPFGWPVFKQSRHIQPVIRYRNSGRMEKRFYEFCSRAGSKPCFAVFPFPSPFKSCSNQK